MRILAARFPDWDHANQALETIHGRLDDNVQAELAPLAPAGESSADDTLLAGHFPDEHKLYVEEIVRQAGGEIVADVDERLTRPRSGPASGSGGSVSTTSEGGGGFSY
jgi:hypothetical protein